jgi:Skp family chaperone for outer membrane proteins
MNGIARFISLPTALLLTGLFLTGCQPQGTTTTTADEATTASTAGPSIVFVRLDSLQTGYTELAIELERLQGNVMAAEENIQAEMVKLQQDAQRVQNKVQRGEMTPNKIQQEQQRLGVAEQKIAQQRDIAMNSIQQDQMRLQQQFGERVKKILEAIQTEKGYDYILNEGGGSGVLVANDAFDITPEVLTRLNAAGGMASDSIK